MTENHTKFQSLIGGQREWRRMSERRLEELLRSLNGIINGKITEPASVCTSEQTRAADGKRGEIVGEA